jgi:hypothetical protein
MTVPTARNWFEFISFEAHAPPLCAILCRVDVLQVTRDDRAPMLHSGLEPPIMVEYSHCRAIRAATVSRFHNVTGHRYGPVALVHASRHEDHVINSRSATPVGPPVRVTHVDAEVAEIIRQSPAKERAPPLPEDAGPDVEVRLDVCKWLMKFVLGDLTPTARPEDGAVQWNWKIYKLPEISAAVFCFMYAAPGEELVIFSVVTHPGMERRLYTHADAIRDIVWQAAKRSYDLPEISGVCDDIDELLAMGVEHPWTRAYDDIGAAKLSSWHLRLDDTFFDQKAMELAIWNVVSAALEARHCVVACAHPKNVRLWLTTIAMLLPAEALLRVSLHAHTDLQPRLRLQGYALLDAPDRASAASPPPSVGGSRTDGALHDLVKQLRARPDAKHGVLIDASRTDHNVLGGPDFRPAAQRFPDAGDLLFDTIHEMQDASCRLAALKKWHCVVKLNARSLAATAAACQVASPSAPQPSGGRWQDLNHQMRAAVELFSPGDATRDRIRKYLQMQDWRGKMGGGKR